MALATLVSHEAMVRLPILKHRLSTIDLRDAASSHDCSTQSKSRCEMSLSCSSAELFQLSIGRSEAQVWLKLKTVPGRWRDSPIRPSFRSPLGGASAPGRPVA